MKRAFLGAVLALSLAAPAAAQTQLRDVQSIAAVVNHEVISVFDLLERMKLVILSSDLRDTPETRQKLLPLVLRSLIDERLELQEAERLSITVADQEIQQALTDIEKQNNIKAGELDAFLAKAGIGRETVINQVRAGLAWGKIIRRRIQPTIDIGEEEIDDAYARLKANKDKPQNLLAEIFLAVDSPEKDAQVRDTAERLVQEVVNGANFAALARQFSESATALNGGDLGWVPEGELGPELNVAIEKLKPPALTFPIHTPGGYYILALRERRSMAQEEAGGTSVSLQQLHLALPAEASKEEIAQQMELARSLRPQLKNCSGLEKLAAEKGSPLSGNLGWLSLDQLPEDLRKVVMGLDVNKVSDPVQRSDGVVLLMVCERKETKASSMPTREDVAQVLLRQRMGLQADRYLRDLRSSASVDARL